MSFYKCDDSRVGWILSFHRENVFVPRRRTELGDASCTLGGLDSAIGELYSGTAIHQFHQVGVNNNSIPNKIPSNGEPTNKTRKTSL